jgi:hypothetical protein
LLAFLTAYVVNRRLVRGGWILGHVAMIPYVIPGIVLAIGFLAAYTRPPFALYGTAWIMIFAFTSRFLPIAYTNSDTALKSVHPELVDAARIAGAGRFVIMRVLAGAELRLQHMLVADAFRIAGGGRLDVDAVQHLVKEQAVDAAPHTAQLERRRVPELGDGEDAGAVKPLLHARADIPREKDHRHSVFGTALLRIGRTAQPLLNPRGDQVQPERTAMSRADASRRRCAIYTRKSSEESDVGQWLRHHGWAGRGDLLRHGMRPGLASHSRCSCVADKTRRHLDAETAITCDLCTDPP